MDSQRTLEYTEFNTTPFMFIIGFNGSLYFNNEYKIPVVDNLITHKIDGKKPPGIYYKKLIPDDIEIWFAFNVCHDLHCEVPFISSKYSNPVMIVDKKQYPYSVFVGQYFVKSQAPESGGLKFVFECPNYLLSPRRARNSIQNVQFTAFSLYSKLLGKPSQYEEYFFKPAGKIIPIKYLDSGMIKTEQLVKPVVLFKGIIKEIALLTNHASKEQFYKMTVETSGLILTVVQHQKSMVETPEIGNVIEVNAWLMGMFVDN
jgi:hypothetical protein